VPTTRMSHEDRHAQLLDVAEELFTSQGYDKVSVEDLARAAGVTRPLIYQHHGSKEGLFIAAAKRARDEFEASILEAHHESGGDLSTFVIKGGDVLFDLLHDHPTRWALLFSGAVGESGELASQLSALRFSTVHKIATLAGEYAPGLDEEHLLAFANAISGISEAFCRWSLSSPEIPRARILGYYHDFITGAIIAALDRARADGVLGPGDPDPDEVTRRSGG